MVDAKMHQNAEMCILKFKFFRGHSPRTLMLGGATAPLPKPTPLGTPALRASHASSLQCLIPLNITISTHVHADPDSTHDP